jgi:uncharacterized membrane protein HdeD (DUF308 family)
MSQAPPPGPPPPSYTPGPGATPGSARPAMLTAAAVVLFVLGGLLLLFGLLAFAGGGLVSGESSLLYLIAVVYLALGALAIYAGVQILKLDPRGRIIGLILAGVGALFTLISIVESPVFAIILLAAYEFVIYALITQAQYFIRR